MFWLPFVLILRRRATPDRPTGSKSIWLAALFPTIPNLIGQVGWAASPYFVDASTIGFVIRIAFLFTVLFGFLLVPSERTLARSVGFYLGAILSLAGLAVMYVPRLSLESFAGSGLAGLMILLGTALCWGAYAVSVRVFLRGFPFRLAFGVVCLYTTAGLVLLAGVLSIFVDGVGIPTDLPTAQWALLILSAMIGIATAHVVYYRGIHGVGPVVANAITMTGPFATGLLAMAFLGERPGILQWLGGGMIVCGGLVLVRSKARISAAQMPD